MGFLKDGWEIKKGSMLRGKENGEEVLSYIALDTNRQRLEVVTFTENPQTYYDTDVPEEKSSLEN